jgi:radical SAM protein with 4Fe4S-binding SPASM domain
MALENDNFPEHFCSLPWLQIHTEPDGKVMPCCYYSHNHQHQLGNWNDNKITDIFHGDQWNKLRKDFLEGKKPDSCSRCWKEEDSGIDSMRNIFNKRYRDYPDHTNFNGYNKFKDIVEQTNADGSVKNIKLGTIDIIFNSLCNFKCRSCGPGLSTSWAVEVMKMGLPVKASLLTNTKIPHMTTDLIDMVNMCDEYTEIHFSGGEPMMQEEHYEFLQLLIDMGKTNIKIRYNTNLSVYELKHYNAFKLLDKFYNVFIIGSIDAMGLQGEYIRKGFDWQLAQDWIKASKEQAPNANYGVSAVYSIFNCEAAIDLHRHMCESDIFTNNNGNKFNFNLNVLHAPIWMQTTILPPKTKQRVSEKILAHLEFLDQTQVKNYDYYHYVDVWKNAMTMMNSKDESKLIPLFFKETQKLDTIRNEDFKILFPELHRDFIEYERSRI